MHRLDVAKLNQAAGFAPRGDVCRRLRPRSPASSKARPWPGPPLRARIASRREIGFIFPPVGTGIDTLHMMPHPLAHIHRNRHSNARFPGHAAHPVLAPSAKIAETRDMNAVLQNRPPIRTWLPSSPHSTKALAEFAAGIEIGALADDEIQAAKRHLLDSIGACMAGVPTIAEAGLPEYEATSWFGWFGLLAPARTPAAAIERLNRAIVEAMKKPESVERVKRMGAEVTLATPDEFRKLIRSDTEKWGAIIKAAGIKAE